MIWEWIFIHLIEIMQYLIIAAGLALCIYAAIASFNPKSMWYDGEKVYCHWEKEDTKKAKSEAKRRKKRKWYQW